MDEDTPEEAAAEKNASDPENDERFTAREAADFLGIPERRLHQLRRHGLLPGVRLGWRKWQFRASDLMEYVESIAPPAAEKPVSSDSGANPPFSSPGMRDIQKAMAELEPPAEEDEDEAKMRQVGEQAPIVRMANAIISNAIDYRVSDIHIELERRSARIRCRVDGVLQEVMMFPSHISWPLIRRYKVMADLDLTGHRAQTGIIAIKYNNHDYQLRVSLVPSYFGETIVIHVLIQGDVIVGLKRLGMRPVEQAPLEELVNYPSGLLLLAGPSNSGLTTTAYNLLTKLNNIDRKVFTLEPLPEYKLGGITQVFTDYTNEMISHRPLNRRETLRTILRQDPDILFIGDLRDVETAADAIEAAAAGVLVLATIGTPDAVTALLRLKDYGVSPERIGRNVIGAVSQRLVRRLCANCKTAYSAAAEEVRWFFEGSYDAPTTETVTLYRGEGCDACDNKGYLGRIGLFEVLTMNHEIGELLRLNAPFADLQEAARANGLTPLRRDGAEKMLSGIAASDDVYQACR